MLKLRIVLLLSVFLIFSCNDTSTSSVTEDLDQSFANQERPEDFVVDQKTYNDFYKIDESKIIRKLDIILVPDTSASIKEERNSIAQGFENFFNSLPKNIDTNIGVLLAHGPKSNKSGKLYKKNNEPLVLKTSELSLEDIKKHLSLKIHKPKEDGSTDGGEAGMYSILEALKSENLSEFKANGLFREDASLAIVFVADEQDICSMAPEGIVLKEDPQNGERKSFVDFCIEEDIKFKDVIMGGRDYTYKITPEIVLNSIRSAHPNGRIVISGVIYDENSIIPTGNEDEIGYGYKELIELSGGVSVDLASGDYSKGLAAMARLAGIEEGEIPNSFSSKVQYTDPSSIIVTLDGVEYTDWSFDKETQKIILADDRDLLAVVGITYSNDTTKPEFINLIDPELLTNENEIDLSFEIKEDYLDYVKVTLNDSEVLNTKTENINLNLSLIEGENLVLIEAKDLSGNISFKEYSIVSDTILPELTNLNPENNTIVNKLVFNITGISSEPLKSALLDGVELNLTDSVNFNESVTKLSEGQYNFELTLIDLAGNTNTYNLSYDIILKLINIDLVTIIPVEEGKVCVKGEAFATKPNTNLTIKTSLFNSKEITTYEDGSFELAFEPASLFTLSATDSNTNNTESYDINFLADTTLTGIIKDIDDTPIPGVKVTIVNSNQYGITDASGVFVINNPQIGDQELLIDATQVSEDFTLGKKEYSSFIYNATISNLFRNVLETPIYIAPKFLDGSETTIENSEGARVTSIHAPGVELDFPNNVITFPNGTGSGTINILEISSDKTSVEMPEATKPNKVYAFEPSGLEFSQRVDLVLPNDNDLPDGTEMIILSKNSKTGFWEPDGGAVVQGGRVVTRPGEGISHFSEIFASPLGMEIKSLGDTDKPGINTFDGSSEYTVSLPSFKVRGSDFTPSLIYKSNWAFPNALVQNIFDIPKFKFQPDPISAGGIGSFGGKKVKLTFDSWITPNSISSELFTSDISSGKKVFNGVPNKSLISYSVDLSNLDSGIYPATSNYEVELKNMTLVTKTVKKKSGPFGGTKKKKTQRLIENIIDDIFPTELKTNIYHSNKINSEYGQGWKLAGVSQILNPNGNRIALEDGVGRIKSYVLSNTLETVHTYDGDVRNIKFNNEENKLQIVKDNKLLTVDEAETEDLSLPGNNVVIGMNSIELEFIERRRVGSSRQSFFFFKCQNLQYSMTQEKTINDFILNGSSKYFVNNEGALYNFNGNINHIAGKLSNVPRIEYFTRFTSSSLNPNNNCNSIVGRNCENEIINRSITYEFGQGEYPGFQWDISGTSIGSNDCQARLGSMVDSSGVVHKTGYNDNTNPKETFFNNPRSIIEGPGDSILIVDYGNHLIRKLDLNNNQIINFAGNKTNTNVINSGLAINSGIGHPRGIAKDKFGNYYISTEAGFIRKLFPNGQMFEYAGQPLGSGTLSDFAFMDEFVLSKPSDIVIDNLNDLMYVADTGNHRIVKIDMIDQTAEVIAGTGECNPGAFDEGKVALDSSLCLPERIELDSDNNLLILDSTNKRIRKLILNNNINSNQIFASIDNDNSQLIKKTDKTFEIITRNGEKTFYDSKGKMTKSIDINGNETNLTYTDEKLTKMTFSTGQFLNFSYSNNKLDSIEDYTGRVTSFSYDNLKLNEVSYPDNSFEQFDYNDKGQLVKSYDKRGNNLTYEYNSVNRLKSITTPEGNITYLNDIASQTEQSNNLQNLDLISDTAIDPNSNQISFSKDLNGYVQSMEDSKGRVSTITRDSLGRPLKVTKFNNEYIEFDYNSFGDLISKYESENNTSETFLYDSKGNLLEYVNQEGLKQIKSYYDNGLLKSDTDFLGNTITKNYFDDGLVKFISNDLNEVFSFEYDVNGNISKRITPEGEEIKYVRDSSGNVIELINQIGTSTLYTYDDFNRLTSITNGVSSSDPVGKITTYQYDSLGNLTKIIDPQNNITEYQFDRSNRLIKKITSLGQITELAYDGNNNLVWEKDPNGNIKTFEYDSDNQLTKKILPDNNYLMEYDLDGNMTLISDSDSMIEFSYEKIGDDYYVTSTTTESDALSEISLVYNYDKVGNRTSMTTPYGDFSYNYDDNNRLTSLNNHKNETFTFGYDSSNRITQIARPNGVSTTHTFDKNSFLANIIHKKSGSDISVFNYTRDFIGNKTSVTTGRGIASYGYDSESQLIGSTNSESGVTESFEYDDLGNRLVDHNGNYNYDAKSQRLTSDWKYNYSYDDNGNLIQRTHRNNITTFTQYTYSSENQLIKVEDYVDNAKTQTVAYAHDALGRRIEKALTNNLGVTTKTRYVYDGQEILAEYDESDALLAVHTHSTLRTDDTLASDIKTTKLADSVGSYFYLKDSLGSIIDITDSSGNIVQHYVYSSFGEKLKVTDNSNNEITPLVRTGFGFTNREHDDETGLMHYRARVFMPEIGRFIQEDPDSGRIASPRTFTSKYIISLNNPLKYVDPTGKFAILGAVGSLFERVGQMIGDALNSELVRIALIIAASYFTGIGVYQIFGKSFLGGVLAGATGAAVGGEVGYRHAIIAGDGKKSASIWRTNGKLLGGIAGGVGYNNALSQETLTSNFNKLAGSYDSLIAAGACLVVFYVAFKIFVDPKIQKKLINPFEKLFNTDRTDNGSYNAPQRQSRPPETVNQQGQGEQCVG